MYLVMAFPFRHSFGRMCLEVDFWAALGIARKAMLELPIADDPQVRIFDVSVGIEIEFASEPSLDKPETHTNLLFWAETESESNTWREHFFNGFNEPLTRKRFKGIEAFKVSSGKLRVLTWINQDHVFQLGNEVDTLEKALVIMGKADPGWAVFIWNDKGQNVTPAKH
jgi:hypothetical protein